MPASCSTCISTANNRCAIDQDLSFGSDDIKEAFFTIKLLKDHDYQGTIGFDAHPYRSEADPWDFVERNLRTTKIHDGKSAAVQRE